MLGSTGKGLCGHKCFANWLSSVSSHSGLALVVKTDHRLTRVRPPALTLQLTIIHNSDSSSAVHRSSLASGPLWGFKMIAMHSKQEHASAFTTG
ncbi:hypothetical protein STEG23_000875, partial [Scotinomys teguina]